LKTIEDALEIRRRVLLAFELAEREACLTGTCAPLNFAVIGGGPTGVELAGAIADIARQALARDFKLIDTTEARVTLYEGSPRVLATYPEDLSRKAERQLKELGVEVHTNSRVTAVEPERIRVGDAWVATSVTLWATGVAASPLGKALAAQVNGVRLDRAGRISVEPDLSLPGHPEVFVIGDMMTLDNLPGVAQVAMQQGKYAADQIDRRLRGKAAKGPFRYFDKGSMATISRFKAVANVGPLRFGGFIAWMLWLVIHVLYLVGFKNRVTTVLHWAVSFIGRGRSQRTTTLAQLSERSTTPGDPASAAEHPQASAVA
jgi:NADH dehydrogenase